MPSRKTLPPSAAISVELLIRASSEKLFTAFVEPKWLKKFWLSKASAPLVLGKSVRWDFKVMGASDHVSVLELVPHQCIAVRWSDNTVTRWTFTALAPKQTVVHIHHAGFKGTRQAIMATVADGTEGYTLVLSDLKILMEKGIRSHLVRDKAILIERSMRAAEAT